jgi:integral membrane protein
MIKTFKVLGWLEGVSLLLLLFVAMPLKYMWGMPEYVSVVGSAHGGLFVAYIIGAMIVGEKLGWKVTTLLLAFILSSVPFGTFIFERKHLSQA